MIGLHRFWRPIFVQPDSSEFLETPDWLMNFLPEPERCEFFEEPTPKIREVVTSRVVINKMHVVMS
jgi:hypothetical protein